MISIKPITIQEGMLASFRRKFVTTNMMFAGVVLLLVFLVVSATSYYEHENDVYLSLNTRMDDAKMRGDLMGGPGRTVADGFFQGAAGSRQATEGADANGGPDGPASNPFQHNRRAGDTDQVVATSLYLLDADWELLVAYDEAFPIDADVISDALVKARDEEGDDVQEVTRGYLGTQKLYYQIEPYNEGFLATFASGYYVERNMINLIIPLLISELGALLAFFGISIVLARWAVRPVEEAWNKQQRFIADASHELKTPLTVIRANDSILLSMPDATIKDQQQWIESTEAEAQLMQDLVNDMLYLAKSDSSRVPLEYSTVNMSDIVNTQLLQFESVAFEKDVEFESNIADQVIVEGDATRLHRLVGTIMDNACKYVDVHGKITVGLARSGSNCQLTVSNTGSVISPDDLPHLFDRFYRSDKARTRTGGYGLGLSIAKQIASDHKGTIAASSSEEAGTTFTVEIPALP